MTPRTFLRRLAIFLAPLAIAFAVLEAGLPRVDNSYKKQRRAIDTQGARTELLLLGTSHMMNGVMAKRLPCPTINLANGGQSLDVDHALLERYLGALPRLRGVLFELSYYSLDLRLARTPGASVLAHYWRWLDVVPQPPLSLTGFHYLSLVNATGLSRSVEYALRGFRVDATPLVDETGSMAAAFEDRSEDSIRRRIAVHHDEMREDERAENLAHLEAMIRSVQARGAGAAVLVLPLHPSYRRRMQPERVAALRSALTRLAAIAPVFDLAADPRFEGHDFADGDHLSPAAAARFSNILTSEVLPAITRCGP